MDCLYVVRTCFGLTSGNAYKITVNKDQSLPNIILDSNKIGNDVVIVKNGHRICGTGAALCNAPIVQNKAYFEIKLQQNGIWGVGLANTQVNLNRVPLGNDTFSWVLRHDGTICHNGQTLYRQREVPAEGDVIGLTFDHIELRFYLNNKPIDYAVTGIRSSDIFPVLYVDDGAILDAAFTNFTFQPVAGFDRIMFEKSLL